MPVPKSGVTLADQLLFSHDGTSGYRTGESAFDQAAFRNHVSQDAARKEEELRAYAQLRRDEWDAIFDQSFKKYLHHRYRQGVMERVYAGERTKVSVRRAVEQ